MTHNTTITTFKVNRRWVHNKNVAANARELFLHLCDDTPWQLLSATKQVIVLGLWMYLSFVSMASVHSGRSASEPVYAAVYRKYKAVCEENRCLRS